MKLAMFRCIHDDAFCASVVLLLTLACATHVSAADFQVGVSAYERGNYSTALEEIRPLADRGEPEAQALLGMMYKLGHGVAEDHAQAAKWFEAAAEQGFAEAQHNLGVMYEEGNGVPKDYVRAHMWYSLAVARYPTGEARELALSMLDRVEAKLTPEQIEEAQRLASAWEPK